VAADAADAGNVHLKERIPPMMRSAVFCLSSVLLGLAAPAARADFLPPVWTYATASNPSVIAPDGSTGPAVVIQGHAGLGGSDIIAATFRTFSNDGAATNIGPTPFTETIFLRSGGHTAQATFDFLLSGSISSSAAYLAVVPTGKTTQTVHLNQFFFDITVDPFHTPANPQPLGGWQSFTVHTHHNPEPASLLLAGIGVPVVAVFLRRRSRPAS
jgi:hypothetical protein